MNNNESPRFPEQPTRHHCEFSIVVSSVNMGLIKQSLVPSVPEDADLIIPEKFMGLNVQISVVAMVFAHLAMPAMISKVESIVAERDDYVKWIWSTAFFINVFSVSQPGRSDGKVKDGQADTLFETIFSPASYAFAIWGVIYIGQALQTAYVASALDLTTQFGATIRNATPYWVAANLFQSFWCVTFRPQFASYQWLPTLSLFLSFLSQLKVVDIQSNQVIGSFANSGANNFSWEYLAPTLARFPNSLHAGWLAAATLLNLNGYVARLARPLGDQVALAFASSYAGFALGAFFSYRHRDPWFGGTIAWALRALAVNTKKQTTPDVGIPCREALASTQWLLAAALVVLSVL